MQTAGRCLGLLAIAAVVAYSAVVRLRYSPTAIDSSLSGDTHRRTTDTPYQWRARDGTLGLPLGRPGYQHVVHDVMQLYNDIEASGRRFAFKDLPRAPGEPSLLAPPHLRVVTACSANHYKESIDMVKSVVRCLPGVHFEYYDLGLRPGQARNIQRAAGVELMPFDYTRYPPEAQYLFERRFKPLVIHDSVKRWWNTKRGREPAAIWWMDASVRLLCRDDNERGLWANATGELESRLRADGVVLPAGGSGHSTYAVTNPRQFDYLPVCIECTKRVEQAASTSVILNLSPSGLLDVFKWWLLCALTPHCFLPKDVAPEVHVSKRSTLSCRFGNDSWTSWGNCVRPDQTTLNMIVGEKSAWYRQRYVHPAPMAIRRSATKMYGSRGLI